MEQRALVFGATGYTGEHVVRVLRSRGIATTAHVRPDSARGQQWESAFAALGADVARHPWTPETIQALVAETRPAWVFALLGTTKARKKARVAAGDDGSLETYAAVDRDLTLQVLNAAADLQPAAVFVYLSSLGADPQARLPYLRVRGEVEGALACGDVPHIIAQPGFITGSDRPESRPMERLGAALSDTSLACLAALGLRGPRDRWASITGGDLAAALVHAALSAPPGSNQTLEPPALRRLAVS